MELLPRCTTFSLCAFLFSVCLTAVNSFSPVDHYLVDCGSAETTTVDVDRRRFTGDSSAFGSRFLSSARTVGLSDLNSDPNLSPIYQTARVFTRPSRYVFEIKEEGTHLVRLHFRQFDFPGFDPCHAKFNVLVNGYKVLYNFNANGAQSPTIKDYLIFIGEEKLVVTLVPSKRSNFAFINAIEVISAPKDLIADVAQFVNSEKSERINGLKHNAFETMHRVNVGGLKVTPFNDSLWRTWIPDDEFVKPSNESKRVFFTGRINYQLGGASREVGPDNVYNSARVVYSSKYAIPRLNLTWVFPVTEGFRYLIRLHFCDIASVSLGMLNFNVYVNDNLAYPNLDLASVTNFMLASPFYADFVVDAENSSVVAVSVGHSNLSMTHGVVAILNGVEVMKLNNSMGGLDGEIGAELVLKSWPRQTFGLYVPFVAALCLLLAASVAIRRRSAATKDSIAWSPLPVQISEVELKHDNQTSRSKV